MDAPQPQNPTEEILNTLKKQNVLLAELVRIQTTKKKTQDRERWWSWGKTGISVGGLLYFLYEAKRFFSSMFDKVTPDLSGLTDSFSGGGTDVNELINSLSQSLGL